MKKQLFDLTIEEFTSVLLDYQPTLELSVCCYDEKGNFINKQITDGEDEEVTVRGTYSDFYNAFLKEPCNNGVKEAVKGFLDSHFDYDMQLNRLDIYNYLEHITSNFHEEKVRIVLNEMDCFYLMVYLEDIDSDVENQYIEKGWEIPTVTRKNRINGQEYTCTDYETMREKIYPCRGFMYHNAIGLLKKSCNQMNLQAQFISRQERERKRILSALSTPCMNLASSQARMKPRFPRNAYLRSSANL